MKNKLLIALTALALTACTSNLHALTKARAFAQTATAVAHTAANYARQNKLKTAGMVIGTWLIADIGGHAIYNKAVKQLKSWKIASAEKNIQSLQQALQREQQMLNQFIASQQNPNTSDSQRRRNVLGINLSQNGIAAMPALILQETASRDQLQQEYAALQAKPSFTERLVSAIAAKIF